MSHGSGEPQTLRAGATCECAQVWKSIALRCGCCGVRVGEALLPSSTALDLILLPLCMPVVMQHPSVSSVCSRREGALNMDTTVHAGRSSGLHCSMFLTVVTRTSLWRRALRSPTSGEARDVVTKRAKATTHIHGRTRNVGCADI